MKFLTLQGIMSTQVQDEQWPLLYCGKGLDTGLQRREEERRLHKPSLKV